jgi:hypothetical protein
VQGEVSAVHVGFSHFRVFALDGPQRVSRGVSWHRWWPASGDHESPKRRKPEKMLSLAPTPLVGILQQRCLESPRQTCENPHCAALGWHFPLRELRELLLQAFLQQSQIEGTRRTPYRGINVNGHFGEAALESSRVRNYSCLHAFLISIAWALARGRATQSVPARCSHAGAWEQGGSPDGAGSYKRRLASRDGVSAHTGRDGTRVHLRLSSRNLRSYQWYEAPAKAIVSARQAMAKSSSRLANHGPFK